jgi:hypothetical protein
VTTPAHRGRCTLALAAASVGVAVALLATCTKVPTNPSAVFSLAVDSIPSPSVVAGDTLRDTTGVAHPLSGRAYNVQGQVLTGLRVRFISLNPDQLTIDSLNFAMGSIHGDSVVRVVADANGLQSLPFTLPVVLRPDSILYADSDSITTIHLSLTALDSNVSLPLDIALRHNPDSLGADSITRSYLVRYQITYPASAAAGTGTPTDTTLPAYLIDASGNPARTDTTDLNGTGTRLVRFQIARIIATPGVVSGTRDSVVIGASVVYRATPIARSPLRFVVHYIVP